MRCALAGTVQYVNYKPVMETIVYKNSHEATTAILKNKDRFISSREVRHNGMLERVIVNYAVRKYTNTLNKLQGK